MVLEMSWTGFTVYCHVLVSALPCGETPGANPGAFATRRSAGVAFDSRWIGSAHTLPGPTSPRPDRSIHARNRRAITCICKGSTQGLRIRIPSGPGRR